MSPTILSQKRYLRHQNAARRAERAMARQRAAFALEVMRMQRDAAAEWNGAAAEMRAAEPVKH